MPFSLYSFNMGALRLRQNIDSYFYVFFKIKIIILRAGFYPY